MKDMQLAREDEVEVHVFLLYLADLGLVGFEASLVIAVAGVALEAVYPGLVFNHIAPQRLVIALVIFGLLALMSPQQKKSLPRTIFFAALSLAVTLLIAIFSWNYFAPLADRLMLTTATTLATVIILVGAMRATTEKVQMK